MTESLLWLARDNQPPLEYTNLCELLETLIEEHRPLIEHKAVSVSIHCQNGCGACLAHNLCRILLNNLIQNAFKFTASGSVDITVDNLEVTISNTSNKSGQESSENTDFAEHTEATGFGLGLHIVQQIADSQQWLLTVVSQDRSGVTIKVDFSAQGCPAS